MYLLVALRGWATISLSSQAGSNFPISQALLATAHAGCSSNLGAGRSADSSRVAVEASAGHSLDSWANLVMSVG